MGLVNGTHSLVIFLVISAAFLDLNPVTAKVDWRTCGKSLPHKCGEAIGQRVNFNKGFPVSVDCCAALVKIGKPCHDDFARDHLKSGAFKGGAYQVIKRSDEVWNECVEVVKFVFPPVKSPKSS